MSRKYTRLPPTSANFAPYTRPRNVYAAAALAMKKGARIAPRASHIIRFRPCLIEQAEAISLFVYQRWPGRVARHLIASDMASFASVKLKAPPYGKSMDGRPMNWTKSSISAFRRMAVELVATPSNCAFEPSFRMYSKPTGCSLTTEIPEIAIAYSALL